jgi:hypothetical protein
MPASLMAWIVSLLAVASLLTPLAAAALPDHRAYELVTRYEAGGHESGLNGVETGLGVPSVDGNSVDWEGIGACCGASSAAVNLFQSFRQGHGWQTKALTPSPPEPLYGIFEEQGPMFFTPDLRQTIFATPVSYAAGDDRPKRSNSYDLYLQGPDGSMTWLSQGPFGTGSSRHAAEFDGATPDAGKVVFSSAEALTANAKGLPETERGPQYLYLRDVEHGTTTLIDVNNVGEVMGDEGAMLGNGSWLNEELVPANYNGTTTNAVSADGSKVFFETPAIRYGSGEPHLYMRDLATSTTTPLDDPSLPGSARYEGASVNGELVFFTSDEGLNGAPSATELYAFNTTAGQIGSIPPMSAAPISLGNGATEPTTTLTAEALSGSSALVVASTAGFNTGRTVEVEGEELKVHSVLSATELEVSGSLAATHPSGASLTQRVGAIVGESAIANDGSLVYFVSNDVLANNANPLGRTAVSSQPNMYLYDTHSGQTTFVATLAWADVNSCGLNCGSGGPAGLVAQPDVARPSYPSRDGSVLVFESSGNLTEQDPAPTTHLTSALPYGESTLQVESTAGFLPHHTITLDTGTAEELEVIESVNGPTELTLVSNDGLHSVRGEHPAATTITQPDVEDYRYDTSNHSLICISCTAPGVTPEGSATLGPSGGGSYIPPGQATPMSEDGSQIFFESSNALLAGVQTVPPSTEKEARNIYEWENGQLSLISDGSTAEFALDGTTSSGDDVFFATSKHMTVNETNGYQEIYDARVGGGFAPPPAEPTPCVAQECRLPSSAPGVFFSTPASATIGGPSVPQLGLVTPTFAVANITAAQRARLARSGVLTLTVTGTAPGKFNATAMAKLRGKSHRVANAAATLSKPGAVTVKLHLSKGAVAQLAAKKALTVHLEVSYTASSTVKLAVLTLHAPTAHTSAARRHGSHA